MLRIFKYGPGTYTEKVDLKKDNLQGGGTGSLLKAYLDVTLPNLDAVMTTGKNSILETLYQHFFRHGHSVAEGSV